MRISAVMLALATQTAAAQPSTFADLARSSLATIDGSVALKGLRDTVRVLRDSSGVAHLYAKNTDDLFFAQGFVQAQDRLWQMEMYRRIYEGRLSEILGERALRSDKLARLMKYRGPFDERETASYHPEGRRIFDAFAAGVNAFIAQAGDNLPVEFKLTGIRPLPWTADIALLRTQTAMPLGDARDELRLARQVAQLGATEANRRARPDPWRELSVPEGIDVSLVTDDVIEALGGLQENSPRPELLPGFRAWPDAAPAEPGGVNENSPGSNNWVVSGKLTASGKVMLANDPHRNVGNPSIRYIVHLVAPGWNVIGATEAPFPGVMIGHNARIAWGLTIFGTDQADVYVEQVNPLNVNEVRWRDAWEPLRIVVDTIRIKDAGPVIVTHRFSRHGPIFYEDTLRRVAYAIRSTMYEPGTAGYLGALRLSSLDDCRQFLDAQAFYKAPSENMICGDAQGNIAWHGSGLAPKRAGWDGRLPVPGNGKFEWAAFRSDLPRELNPARGWIATANHNTQPRGFHPPLFIAREGIDGRYRRLAEVLANGRRFTMEDFQRLQHDARSTTAARDVPLFRGWMATDPATERGRSLLAKWDATYQRESAAAALYSYVARVIPPNDTRPDTLQRVIGIALDSLIKNQGDNPVQWRWGRINRSEFPHSLVRSYDIPGIERSGGAGTVASIGATFREIIDFANLDRSMATNVPGQSGQPGSPFYSNLARPFADQRYFPLLFTQPAVDGGATHRLLLAPRND
jgi:penicillin amidase